MSVDKGYICQQKSRGRSAKFELILTTLPCVQHPWKLTSRDYWSSRNERQPLSKLKHVLRRCSGVSQKQCMLSFQTFAIVFSTPENLLVGISGVLGMKGSSWPQDVSTGGRSAKWLNHLDNRNLCHCVQHPENCTSRDYWSSRPLTVSTGG